PEVLDGIVRSYEDACAVCITRYEGYVFQRLGDGIVAFFGYPLAHEGEAERAIHAGLAMFEPLSSVEVPGRAAVGGPRHWQEPPPEGAAGAARSTRLTLAHR